MNIGQRIKARRKELKLSAEELGQRLGKDRSTVYRYENGDIENLPLPLLEPIAEALETTPAQLMGWDIEEKKKPAKDSGLSAEQKAIIEFAKTVPQDKAAMILRVIKSIAESD